MHPRTFGPYTLLNVLGIGRLGPVHLGRTDKGARVAVRVIRPEFAADPRFRACLREEMEVVSGVRGPGVAALVAADVEADEPWVATQYVRGPTLATVLTRSGPLAVDGVRSLGVQLADALATIHDAGAVHGDLTPRTVLVTAAGVRVIDAGVARAATASPLTRCGGLLGTPGYLAPEQLLHGRGGPASDVFALGSVLLHAATWRPPFGAGDVTTVLHRVLRVGPDLRGLDPELAPIVARCLHPDPPRRPTPGELREALTAPTPAEEDAAAAPPEADAGPQPDDTAPDPAATDEVPAPRSPEDETATPEAVPADR